MFALILAKRFTRKWSLVNTSLNIEFPPLPRAFLKILEMANMSPTEPAMHLTKVTMTTILPQTVQAPVKSPLDV